MSVSWPSGSNTPVRHGPYQYTSTVAPQPWVRTPVQPINPVQVSGTFNLELPKPNACPMCGGQGQTRTPIVEKKSAIALRPEQINYQNLPMNMLMNQGNYNAEAAPMVLRETYLKCEACDGEGVLPIPYADLGMEERRLS